MANVGQGLWPAGDTSDPQQEEGGATAMTTQVGSATPQQVTFSRKETLGLLGIGVVGTATLLGVSKWLKNRKGE